MDWIYAYQSTYNTDQTSMFDTSDWTRGTCGQSWVQHPKGFLTLEQCTNECALYATCFAVTYSSLTGFCGLTLTDNPSDTILTFKSANYEYKLKYITHGDLLYRCYKKDQSYSSYGYEDDYDHVDDEDTFSESENSF
eukprot:UN23124